MKTEGERREKYARIRSLYSLYMLNLSSNCTNVCMSTRHWWWEREKKNREQNVQIQNKRKEEKETNLEFFFFDHCWLRDWDLLLFSLLSLTM